MNFICTGNKSKKEFFEIFDTISSYFSNLGHNVYLDEFSSNNLYDKSIIRNISEINKDCSFVVSLGGDGSILSAVFRMSDNQLPILGVHIGELGFLNQATKNNYIKIIDDIVSKDRVSFQEHFLLDATIFKDKTDIYTFKSLNDFAINQITYSRLLQIDVKVNNKLLNRYNCDGIIICSSLGSTAYSLSAGGPIVSQDVDCLIITPVSPHSLSARPIVVNPNSEIEISFPKLNNKIGIYADGQTYRSLESDNIIKIQKSKVACKLIKTTFSEDYFTILRKKLNWFGEHRS